jgi:hypothetical protein
MDNTLRDVSDYLRYFKQASCWVVLYFNGKGEGRDRLIVEISGSS